MSSDTDQFFEEEEELARKQADAGTAKGQPKQAEKTTKTPAAQASAKGGAKPPSFAMVVVIALVALLVGVCIGYFFAMLVVDRTDASVSTTSTSQVVATTSGDASSTLADMESEMPEGHPDITSMMNADGTVNQEAVDAYKAQIAQEKEAGAASDDSTSADGDASGDEGASETASK